MKIRSAQGDYEVKFVDRFTCSPDDLVIVDEHVERLHGDGLLQSIVPPSYSFRSTEANKTLEMVGQVCLWMRGWGITKGRGTVVAVGGGILQDVVATACHLYHRGVRWEFWPTTLLAMADSCIGGKAGLNHEGSKNLLGCFSAPSEVCICTKFIHTLSPQEVHSGFGEAYKLCWIGGTWYDDHTAFGLGDNLDVLHQEVIQKCLEVKRWFVEDDEFETGHHLGRQRIFLSYGHTLAHAIESLSMPGTPIISGGKKVGYHLDSSNSIPHGLAVAAGMRFANWVSLQCGLLDADDHDRAAEALAAFPVRAPDRHEELMRAIALDKKASGGKVDMVLTSGPGKMELYPVTLVKLGTHLSEFLAQQ